MHILNLILYHKSGFFLTFSLGYLTGVVHAQSLDNLIKTGFSHSPLLKSKTEQTKMAKESYHKESIFIDNLRFSYNHRNVPITSWPALDKHAMSGQHFKISQKLALPWESNYRKSNLMKHYLSQREKEKDSKRVLQYEISRFFHQLHFQYRKADLLRQSKDSLHQIAKISRTLVAVNKMSSSQVLKIEADISILESQTLETEAMISQSQAKIERLCGIKINWQTKKSKLWLKKSKAVQIPSTMNVQAHPLFHSMKLKVEAAQARYAHEKAKLLPEISLSVGYTLRKGVADTDAGDDFLSFEASVPLPLYYPLKEKHSIAAAKHSLQAIQEELKDLQLFLKSSWEAETKQTKNLLEAYQNFEREALPKYLAAYKTQLKSLATGRIGLREILDSYRKYLDVSIQQAQFFVSLQQSLARLIYLEAK